MPFIRAHLPGLSLEFTPPYEYTFTCSSNILATYVAVFVYLYLAVAFIIPLVGVATFLLRRVIPQDEHGNPQYPVLYDLATWPGTLTICGPVYDKYDVPPFHRLQVRNRVLNRLSGAAGCWGIQQGSSLQTAASPVDIRYFKKIEYWLSLFQLLCIMVSFGVLFPPLCAMAVVAVISKTFVMQVMIQQFVKDANEAKQPNSSKALASLRDNLDSVGNLYKHMCWWAFPTSALFCAFMVFDTLGDAVGAYTALWSLLSLSAVPVVIYGVSKVISNRVLVCDQLGSLASVPWRHNLEGACVGLANGRSERFGMPSTAVVSDGSDVDPSSPGGNELFTTPKEPAFEMSVFTAGIVNPLQHRDTDSRIYISESKPSAHI